MVANPPSFRAVYDTNHQPVRALLVRLVGAQDADDLAQVVFAKAAEALATFRGEAEVSTWLYRIASNVAADWIKSRPVRETRATVPISDSEELIATASAAQAPPTLEQTLATKDLKACLRAEIAKLSETHREILMLSMLGELGDSEIAQTLGITLTNVRVRLHRARQEFREIIAARCDFYQHELSCRPSSPDCCTPPPADAVRKSAREL